MAVAQPNSMLGDLEYNIRQHVAAIEGTDAEVMVFPELSLTGYGMEVEAIDLEDPRLSPLADVCRSSGCVALVGAATTDSPGQHSHISVLRIDSTGVSVVYTKMFLSGDESNRFDAGTTAEVVDCLLYTSPSPRDQRGSRMPSSA